MDVRQTALDKLTYGLYVVGSHFEGRLNGQITDALMQVTAFPPRVAVSINKNELTHEYITKSGVFAVSVLGQSAEMKLIGLFGFRSGRDVDKFAQVKHTVSEAGCPLLTEHAVAGFEAGVLQALDVGSHTVFVGEVRSAVEMAEMPVLTYRHYTENMKGRVPKNSPSYRGEEGARAGAQTGTGRYVCTVCGYVYDPETGDPVGGIAAGTPFAALPDGWVCPVCGVGKAEFSPAPPSRR